MNHLQMKLHCPEDRNDSNIDYSRSYFSFTLKYPANDQLNGINFITFSDLVSETTSSYDVIGFYISFILVIGNLIRNLISGEETRIILTEMPEPESLLNLCE